MSAHSVINQAIEAARSVEHLWLLTPDEKEQLKKFGYFEKYLGRDGIVDPQRRDEEGLEPNVYVKVFPGHTTGVQFVDEIGVTYRIVRGTWPSMPPPPRDEMRRIKLDDGTIVWQNKKNGTLYDKSDKIIGHDVVMRRYWRRDSRRHSCLKVQGCLIGAKERPGKLRFSPDDEIAKRWGFSDARHQGGLCGGHEIPKHDILYKERYNPDGTLISKYQAYCMNGMGPRGGTTPPPRCTRRRGRHSSKLFWYPISKFTCDGSEPLKPFYDSGSAYIMGDRY